MATLALENIFQLMRNRKMELFTLNMIIGDLLVDDDSCTTTDPDFDAEIKLMDAIEAADVRGQRTDFIYEIGCPFFECVIGGIANVFGGFFFFEGFLSILKRFCSILSSACERQNLVLLHSAVLPSSYTIITLRMHLKH